MCKVPCPKIQSPQNDLSCYLEDLLYYACSMCICDTLYQVKTMLMSVSVGMSQLKPEKYGHFIPIDPHFCLI